MLFKLLEYIEVMINYYRKLGSIKLYSCMIIIGICKVYLD